MSHDTRFSEELARGFQKCVLDGANSEQFGFFPEGPTVFSFKDPEKAQKARTWLSEAQIKFQYSHDGLNYTIIVNNSSQFVELAKRWNIDGVVRPLMLQTFESLKDRTDVSWEGIRITRSSSNHKIESLIGLLGQAREHGILPQGKIESYVDNQYLGGYISIQDNGILHRLAELEVEAAREVFRLRTKEGAHIAMKTVGAGSTCVEGSSIGYDSTLAAVDAEKAELVALAKRERSGR